LERADYSIVSLGCQITLGVVLRLRGFGAALIERAEVWGEGLKVGTCNVPTFNK
jgi:hypothetical protein